MTDSQPRNANKKLTFNMPNHWKNINRDLDRLDFYNLLSLYALGVALLVLGGVVFSVNYYSR